MANRVARRAAWVAMPRLAAVALLLSCLPTEPCACPPARTWFLMFGEVARADGSAVPVGPVRFTARDVSASGSCDAAARLDFLDPPEILATNGRFRATLFSMGAPGPRCVRVVAYAGDAAGSDSAVVDGLIVQFRGGERLDSLGIRLTIP